MGTGYTERGLSPVTYRVVQILLLIPLAFRSEPEPPEDSDPIKYTRPGRRGVTPSLVQPTHQPPLAYETFQRYGRPTGHHLFIFFVMGNLRLQLTKGHWVACKSIMLCPIPLGRYLALLRRHLNILKSLWSVSIDQAVDLLSWGFFQHGDG